MLDASIFWSCHQCYLLSKLRKVAVVQLVERSMVEQELNKVEIGG